MNLATIRTRTSRTAETSAFSIMYTSSRWCSAVVLEECSIGEIISEIFQTFNIWQKFSRMINFLRFKKGNFNGRSVFGGADPISLIKYQVKKVASANAAFFVPRFFCNGNLQGIDKSLVVW